ncbi:MAG: ABC transporter substrate-binding protein, partial [bacterium]
VKFTYDSILDPKVNSVRRSSYMINNVPISFVVVDPYTIRAVLPQTFAPFLVRMGMEILPKHILQGQDLNTTPFNRNPIGTGPFKFLNWRSAESVTLIRNDDYYKGKPKLGKVVFRIIPDANAELVALEAGEIDSAGIPPKDYTRMLGKKDINVFKFDTLSYTYLGFNNRSPKFRDRLIRQAIAYGTNKDQLVKLVFKGLARPAYTPSSPSSWAYSDDVPKFSYNPKKAKKLIELAGYKMGTDGYYYKDGNKLEFTVMTNQGNKEREKAAIIMKQQYKKIGVLMDIKILEWSSLLKIVNAPDDPKKFDAVLMAWSLAVDPDNSSIWHSREYPRGLNFIGYRNSKLDRLLDLGVTTMSREERKKIYALIDKIIAWDQPYVFLWYPKSVSGVRDRVGGLSDPGPLGGLFRDMEKVFVVREM